MNIYKLEIECVAFPHWRNTEATEEFHWGIAVIMVPPHIYKQLEEFQATHKIICVDYDYEEMIEGGFVYNPTAYGFKLENRR